MTALSALTRLEAVRRAAFALHAAHWHALNNSRMGGLEVETGMEGVCYLEELGNHVHRGEFLKIRMVARAMADLYRSAEDAETSDVLQWLKGTARAVEATASQDIARTPARWPTQVQYAIECAELAIAACPA